MTKLLTNKKFIFIAGVTVLIGVLVGIIIAINTPSSLGSTTLNTPTVSEGTYRHFTFFSSSTVQTDFATTTSATSTNITPYFDSNNFKDTGAFVIAGAKKVTFYFSRTGEDGNQGSTRFQIETASTSTTGSNWYDYNELATSTTGIEISQVIISQSTSTVIASMRLLDEAFYAVRCIAIEATDGHHSCEASASW